MKWFSIYWIVGFVGLSSVGAKGGPGRKRNPPYRIPALVAAARKLLESACTVEVMIHAHPGQSAPRKRRDAAAFLRNSGLDSRLESSRRAPAAR